ncbi:hypothetical protein Ddye_016712 [Dipteronia dyeriana]|uniref:Uncharacterized protein n=1 Tax=Dipteronia dyeriana TaxID=168575 RepID=A0AAD9U800_9ROSI|nr:hypothetical protein Ddye_016712 [Dipteronia dyeriana]
MADLQKSSAVASTSTTSPANPSGQEGSINMVPSDVEKLIESLLLIPEKRDNTLAAIFKKMESGENLAPLLWNSVNTVFILLMCIASHPDTRTRFLRSEILSFIYPFMETKIQGNKPHETLRTGSLSVFDGLLTAALNIIRKILENDAALNHFCSNAARFDSVHVALESLIKQLAVEPSPELLKQDDPVVTNGLDTLIRRVTSRAMHQRQ